MNNERMINIVKELNDSRSKLSALYSLYNSSLMSAENDRSELGVFYEQMIDLKNDIHEISNIIAAASKAEKLEAISRNRSKIKRLNLEANQANDNFATSCKKYNLALKDCKALKSEYKQNIASLCKEFKELITEQTEETLIKGYKQQVRIIKAILDKIDLITEKYKQNKQQVEADNSRFVALYESVNSMLERLDA